MSWSIYTKGTKKSVLKAVQDHNTIYDTNQYNPAKSLLLEEIKLIDDRPGVIVDLQASGSVNVTPGGGTFRSLNIKLSMEGPYADPAAHPNDEPAS